jgi:hypothetical protein
MKISISLIEQAPVGWAHLSRPRSVYAPPLDYKRERAPVRTQGPILGSSSGSIQTSSSNTHPSGRRVLRSGGPNHSKILMSFLYSSAHRSSAPKSPPNPS